MKTENYYCNDEIDRASCPLYYKEKEDSYKIGKHTVPSLNEIVLKLTGSSLKNIYDKHILLKRLHAFLLTGEKFTVEDVENGFDKHFCIALAGDKEIYNPILDEWIKDEDYDKDYKDNTPKHLLKKFQYTKEITVQKTDPFNYIINLLNKELEENLNSKYNDVRIANIEKHFYQKKTNTSFFDSLENIRHLPIAWYTLLERVCQQHYHLAKKQTEREDLYFASQIDLATEDTLYYVVAIEDIPSFNIPILAISLYLNFQNIDLKKKYLKALILSQNGAMGELDFPIFDSELMDAIVEIYKKGEVIVDGIIPDSYIPSDSDLIIILRDVKSLSYPFEEYIYSVIQNARFSTHVQDARFITQFGFPFSTYMPEDNNITAIEDLLCEKAKVIKTLILVLKIIRNITKTYNAEYALLVISSIKDTIKKRCKGLENCYLISSLNEMVYNEGLTIKAVEEWKEKAIKLGDASNFFDLALQEQGIQEVKYQDITLDLRITKEQKKALLHYLNANLITPNVSSEEFETIHRRCYQETLKDEDDACALIEPPNLNATQIICIKEKKKYTTINNKSVVLTGLYKKDGGYSGAVRAKIFFECKIINSHVYIALADDYDFHYLICVDVLEEKKKRIFTLYFGLYDIRKIKDKTEEIKQSIKEQNQKLTLFFDTFSIKRGEFNFTSWVGKTGRVALETKEVDENGKPYFITKNSKGVLFINESDLRNDEDFTFGQI